MGSLDLRWLLPSGRKTDLHAGGRRRYGPALRTHPGWPAERPAKIRAGRGHSEHSKATHPIGLSPTRGGARRRSTEPDGARDGRARFGVSIIFPCRHPSGKVGRRPADPSSDGTEGTRLDPRGLALFPPVEVGQSTPYRCPGATNVFIFPAVRPGVMPAAPRRVTDQDAGWAAGRAGGLGEQDGLHAAPWTRLAFRTSGILRPDRGGRWRGRGRPQRAQRQGLAPASDNWGELAPAT